MKILIYYVGKPRDPHANGMAEEFVLRTTRYARCEMREIDPARFDPWAKHPSASKILLDPEGKVMDSPRFAKLVSKSDCKRVRYEIAEGSQPAKRLIKCSIR